MGIALKPKKIQPLPSKRKPEDQTVVVVIARSSADDMPLRAFFGSNAMAEALTWATKLAKSREATTETTHALAAWMGWSVTDRMPTGITHLTLVTFDRGVPKEQETIAVAAPRVDRTVRYSDA
jgi:alpha-ketoglutarate-dependent taurine dioxygenase